jgi:8-oxo-dGTP pyrophosphatase MutT (NUDIX family)
MPKLRLKRQVAALPIRVGGDGLEVLLVTSRDTQRWVLPKGNIEKDLGASGSAAQEGFEEAGIEGFVSDEAIGTYEYEKIESDGKSVLCQVDVYPMIVEQVHDRFPEWGQRQSRWMTPGAAALNVREGGLVEILLGPVYRPGLFEQIERERDLQGSIRLSA